MEGTDLATLDLVIIALYFAVVLAIGLSVARGVRTGEDLFLAGRSLRWPLIGGSLFASNISSTTLIGLAGAAYVSGISVSNYEWMAGVVLVFMSVFFIPLYLRARISTVPEYLELRFDRRSRLYFSAITIVLSILVDTAGGIYAGAVVLRTFAPDLGLWETCFALAIVAGLYTAAGGLRAVVLTDALQAVILIVGSTILTIIVFAEFGFSWSAATEAVPDGHLSLIRPLDDEALPWLGTLIGVPILGFWYWACNQYITQRVLGAASLRDAQWGANLGGLLKLLPLFIMVIPGAMAIGLFPDLENGDQVFPTLVAEMLPIGLTGLVLAGLLAAIMSSIDSTLNSASTLVLKDFVEREGRILEPRALRNWGRATTLILMTVAAIWAPNIANFGGLFSYLQQAFSILVPPVVAVFLLGAFWRRGGGRACITTLVIGHIAGIALFIASQTGLWTLHFTINVGIMTALSAILFVVLASREPAPEEAKTEGLVWRPGALDTAEGDLPPLRRPTLQGIAILGLTALMVAAF
ncbi:MAG: sodium:solute symporter [Paracoccaceae bacterium]